MIPILIATEDAQAEPPSVELLVSCAARSERGDRECIWIPLSLCRTHKDEEERRLCHFGLLTQISTEIRERVRLIEAAGGEEALMAQGLLMAASMSAGAVSLILSLTLSSTPRTIIRVV
ncbi:MAG: hypothetical protein AB8B85_21530 [Paracoccaceae bacterium]